jgi:hypothetical protein
MGQEEHHLPEPAVLLAQELYKLSFEEREKVFSDVHGVSDVIDETPQLLAESLAGFNKALQAASMDNDKNNDKNNNKSVYDLAKEQDENYVKALDFQLKFLRADNFNPVKAAARMLKYLEAKQKLFGSDKLTKNITLNHDFSAEDLQVARSGLGSLLPLRDRTGRLVLCWMTQLRGDGSFLARVSYVMLCHVMSCYCMLIYLLTNKLTLTLSSYLSLALMFYFNFRCGWYSISLPLPRTMKLRRKRDLR